MFSVVLLLQMARLRSNTINFEAAKAMNAVTKDADMSPFSACTKLFEPRNVGATANPPTYVCWFELCLAFHLLSLSHSGAVTGPVHRCRRC